MKEVTVHDKVFELYISAERIQARVESRLPWFLY